MGVGSSPRSGPISLLQPASSLATEKPVPCGSSNTSSRSCDTSIPPKHCSIILASLPCWCGLEPWQLCGNGRNDWSTKLIRGLVTEAATGFQSRRGRCREPTPVTPHYAPFPTYKAAGLHLTSGVLGRVAASGRREDGP